VEQRDESLDDAARKDSARSEAERPTVEGMLASVSDLAPTEQVRVFERIHRHLSDQLSEQLE
jgi:hypothetical protein